MTGRGPTADLRLGGLYEVAALLGISKAAVAARRATIDPPFPKPIAGLRCGPIWDLEHIEQYERDRRRFIVDPGGRVTVTIPVVEQPVTGRETC